MASQILALGMSQKDSIFLEIHTSQHCQEHNETQGNNSTFDTRN